MDWISTNIRFPKEEYMELKIEAARLRKSLAALIRERVIKKKRIKRTNIEKELRKLDKLAKENSRQNPGISFSEKLIEMRYEQ